MTWESRFHTPKAFNIHKLPGLLFLPCFTGEETERSPVTCPRSVALKMVLLSSPFPSSWHPHQPRSGRVACVTCDISNSLFPHLLICWSFHEPFPLTYFSISFHSPDPSFELLSPFSPIKIHHPFFCATAIRLLLNKQDARSTCFAGLSLNSILKVGTWVLLIFKLPDSDTQESLILTPTEILYNYKLDVLIELCPLRELRRLSTEPPALSLGLSMCSLSGCEDGGEPGIPSRPES